MSNISQVIRKVKEIAMKPKENFEAQSCNLAERINFLRFKNCLFDEVPELIIEITGENNPHQRASVRIRACDETEKLLVVAWQYPNCFHNN